MRFPTMMDKQTPAYGALLSGSFLACLLLMVTVTGALSHAPSGGRLSGTASAQTILTSGSPGTGAARRPPQARVGWDLRPATIIPGGDARDEGTPGASQSSADEAGSTVPGAVGDSRTSPTSGTSELSLEGSSGGSSGGSGGGDPDGSTGVSVGGIGIDVGTERGVSGTISAGDEQVDVGTGGLPSLDLLP